MNHSLCIHSLVEGLLGSPQFLAIINKVTMNIVEHVSVCYNGASFGYMPRISVAATSGRTISKFLQKCHIDFQVDSVSLKSHQLWRKVLFFPISLPEFAVT